MKDCIDKIVRYCYQNGYISENQVPWLGYSIEKRLSSIIGIIPFAFLAFFYLIFGAHFTSSRVFVFCVAGLMVTIQRHWSVVYLYRLLLNCYFLR